MAKTPTAKPTTAHTGEKSAPSQPWAAPGQSGGIPQQDALAAADAPALAGSGDVPSEKRDQITPHGEDESSVLYGKLKELSEDEQDEFRTFMEAQAKAKIDQLTRGREARAMEVNIIDGNAHYGNNARKARAKQVEA